MKRIYIVLDMDNNKALKAFADEKKANEYADEYYENKNIDTRVDEVWYNEYIDWNKGGGEIRHLFFIIYVSTKKSNF